MLIPLSGFSSPFSTERQGFPTIKATNSDHTTRDKENLSGGTFSQGYIGNQKKQFLKLALL